MVDQIPREEFHARLERTRRLTAERGLDGLLVIGRSFYDRTGDLAYLTNHFPPFPTTVFSGTQRGLGHSLLVLPVAGAPVLVIDGRAYRRELVVIEEVRADTDLARGVVAALRDRGLGAGRVGLVGEDIIPLALYRALTEALPALELRAADGRIRPGTTEAGVCAAGIAAAMEAGADFIRYLRVHSGPYSSYGSRWPQATSRVIEEGELVTLDIIGAVRGYQFDVLRTAVAGGADGEQRRLLGAVARALEAAVAAARPGAPCGDLVRLANGLLEEAGYGAHARTFMGHGIGLETVEDPYLTPDVTTRLAPGMVLCIEPGVYIPGWGGASIEQEVIVTEGAPDVITPTPVGVG